MEYIEPTASSRRSLIIVLVTAFGVGLFIVAFRDEAVAAVQARIAALPRCESVTVFRWLGLTVLGIPTVLIVWLAWLAAKSLKLDQWPLPGTWVLRRTPIRRGRSVKWRAYAVLLLSVVAITVGVRAWYLLERSADRMAKSCRGQAAMQPNNALERIMGQRGPRLAAARASWSAAQRGR